jgi:hypothetical protein
MKSSLSFVISSILLGLAANGCAPPSASPDPEGSEMGSEPASEAESALTKSSAKTLFAAIDAQTATFSQVASALRGKWSPAPGHGSDDWVQFGPANSAGTMSFSYQLTIPDIEGLEAGYGVAVAKSMFSAAHYAELKALTPAVLAAAGGELNADGLPQLVVTGRAHIEAPLPFSGYRVVFVADKSVPKAFQTELDVTTASFATYATFDHTVTPCLKSHVDLGGVVCDKRGPAVTQKGTGIVDLWLAQSGGTPNPMSTTSSTSHVFQRRVFQP